MRKKLKIKSVCLALLIVLAFSGCGTGGDGQTAENEQEGQVAENHEPGLDTEDGQGEPEIPESTDDAEQGAQSTQTGERDIDEALAALREEMKQNRRIKNGVDTQTAPDESKYPEIDFGKMQTGPELDSREQNDAFAAAGEYLQDKYGHEVDNYTMCFDPRMYDIYGSDDKGVADGYDDGDIFLVEYEEDDGSWMYLTLVRDGKGSDWKVVGDGKDYTVPAE